MANPTYKHLEDRLRLGPLTVGQWSQILCSTTIALVFAVYLSPFGISITAFLSILAAGLPLALSYGAMGLEFSVLELLRAAGSFYRTPRRYLAGPGTANPPGYLAAQPHDENANSNQTDPSAAAQSDWGSLWDR